MDWSDTYEEFLAQVTEVQRQLFQGLTSAMPGGENSSNSDIRDSFENVLNFQEKLVNGSLETQTSISRFVIETQRQLWQSYFSMMRSK